MTLDGQHPDPAGSGGRPRREGLRPDAGPAPCDRPGARGNPLPLAGSVPDDQRIASIDVLRGVALLGILVVNIQSFSMISAAYLNPAAYGDLSGVHYGAWLVTHVLFEQKFMTIFSLLFGAGIALMADRREARGLSAGAIHYRRMAWLTIFGLLHAHLLWFGDILYFYGICGMLVYPLRRLPRRVLLVAGLGSLAVASMLFVVSGASMTYWPAEQLEAFERDWLPDPQVVDEELATYRGTWLTQMTHRVPTALSFETLIFLTWGLWRAGGLMLIGMALFRERVFSAERSRSFYLSLIGAGLAAGLPLVLIGVVLNQRAGWVATYSLFFGSQFNYWGSVPVSLGYVGATMLVCQTGLVPRLSAALAAVGRTALSNYLLQTVICTTLFYGHGFGLFGSVERGGQILIVVAVWIVQLALAPLWLAHFRFGPAEWFWRALTYVTIPPLRRRAAPVP